MIKTIKDRISDLNIAHKYYATQNSVFTKTTDIGVQITSLKQSILEIQNFLNDIQQTLAHNIKIFKNFFLNKRINLLGIEKNVTANTLTEIQQREEIAFHAFGKKFSSLPRHSASLYKSNGQGPPQCLCGCNCINMLVCDCNCGCMCGSKEKERKTNDIHKKDFFKNPVISKNYEHYKKGIYRLKTNGTPVVKNAYYLEWDYLHNDIEVYSKSRKHLGSLDPNTFKLCKPAEVNREFSFK